MALTSAGYRLSITLQGASMKTATLQVALRSATFAAATTDAATFIDALNLVTSAVIVRYSLAERFIEDTLVPPATVDLTDVMVLTGLIDGELGKAASVRVPGFSRAAQSAQLLSTTGLNASKIDTSIASIQNYWDLFASTGVAFISDGEDAEPTSNNGLYAGRLISRGTSEP